MKKFQMAISFYYLQTVSKRAKFGLFVFKKGHMATME